jgi:hypothetical protein
VAVNHPRKLWGFKSLPTHQCRLSRHRGRGRLLQAIVDRPASVEWLVGPGRVEGQGAEQLAVVAPDDEAAARTLATACVQTGRLKRADELRKVFSLV